MRRHIRKGLETYFNKKKAKHRENYFKSTFRNLNINEIVEGEKEHIDKWSGFGLKVNPIYYRIYAQVTGKTNIDFVPEDLYQLFITNILNQQQEKFGDAYADKNAYTKLHDPALFPVTVLRNIEGLYYDKNYKRLNLTELHFKKLFLNDKSLIVKPTIDSGAGKMVKKFVRNTDGFYYDGDTKFTKSYLSKVYRENFIVQECLEQHSLLSQFNRSSLNTIRVMTYRSVKDEQIKILGAMLKVGGKNSVVDHMAAGGCAIGVNEDGSLINWGINKAGVKLDSVNNINLNKELKIPRYNDLKKISKQIAENNPYHRMLGLDMTIDNKNNVRVIEINNGYVGLKGYQLTGRPFFQKYTDEVIDYCKSNIDFVQKQFVLKI